MSARLCQPRRMQRIGHSQHLLWGGVPYGGGHIGAGGRAGAAALAQRWVDRGQLPVGVEGARFVWAGRHAAPTAHAQLPVHDRDRGLCHQFPLRQELQHLGGGATDRGICQNPRNPLVDRPPLLRALLVALDQWVSSGRKPPQSRYPRIADGTLVDLETFRKAFPKIPGVDLPTGYYMPFRLDFGARWSADGIAEYVPPRVGSSYRTLVPAVDADGNELAGVRLPDVAVPLATYTGWNLRAAEYGAGGMLAPYHGSYLAFAPTRDERLKSGDPRPSAAERYPTREVYLAKTLGAVVQLREHRFLLDDDALKLLKSAAEREL